MLTSKELEATALADRRSASLVRGTLTGLSSELVDELCALADREGPQAVLDLLRRAQEVFLEEVQALESEVKE